MTAAGAGAHICIVVQNMSVPLDRRVWSECRTLVGAGYSVSVVCPRFDGEDDVEEVDGVVIHRYRAAPAARGILGYLIEFTYCWLSAARLVRRIHRRRPIDILQACNPPDTYWLLALLLRRSGTAFVFDHHDLCPELYRSRGGRPLPLVAWLLERLERATYRTADAVICTNESYRRIACGRTGRPSDDVTIVRSGPDPEKMRRTTPRPELRDGHEHLVGYLGIMGPQDGVDLVVRAASVVVHELGRTDIRFALLGYGDCLADLQLLAKELDVDEHVHFTGLVELGQITDWMSTADLGLSPDPWTPFNDASTMNKTLEYLAFGLPVVAFELTETVVSAGDAAVYVPVTGDRDAEVRAYAEAIVELLDDPERREAMGRSGRARIEAFLGWPASARAYLDLYRRLLDTGHTETDSDAGLTAADLTTREHAWSSTST